MDGVILIDEPHLHALGLDPKDGERYIVLEPNNPLNIADLWRTGVRYLAFTSDPISVTKMAILAAELRLATSATTHEWGIPKGLPRPAEDAAAALCNPYPGI